MVRMIARRWCADPPYYPNVTKPKRPNHAQRDRAHGAGLPSGIDFTRLAQRFANTDNEAALRERAVQIMADHIGQHGLGGPSPEPTGLYEILSQISALNPGKYPTLDDIEEELSPYAVERWRQMGRPTTAAAGTRHVASRTAAMAQGFEPVAGHPDMYRKAHDIWDLRPAEDGEGYMLVRKQEELAPDLRRTARREPSPEYAVGQRVAFTHRGQLADAMIVFINPTHEVADLLTTEGDEHVHDVPTNHLMAPTGAPAEDAGAIVIDLASMGGGAQGPFEPAIEPTSKLARSWFEIGAPGQMVEATTSFRPAMMGPSGGGIQQHQIYTVESSHRPDARLDRLEGVPNPISPEERGAPSMQDPYTERRFWRIKLVDDDGNAIWIAPHEYDKYFELRSATPELGESESAEPTPPPAPAMPSQEESTVVERPLGQSRPPTHI